MTATVQDRLMSEQEVARLCGVGRSTVSAWRMTGRGPASVKLGGSTIRYWESGVLAWIAAQ